MANNRRNFVLKAIVGIMGLLAGCPNSGQSNSGPTPQDTTTNGGQPESQTVTKTQPSSAEPSLTTRVTPTRPPETLGTNETLEPRGGVIKFSQIEKKDIPNDRETISGRKLKEVEILWKTLEDAYQSNTAGATVSPEQMQDIERTLKGNRAFYYVRYKNELFS